TGGRRSMPEPAAPARLAATAATRTGAVGHATARDRRTRSSGRTGPRCRDSCRIDAAAARSVRSASHPHGPAPWPADRSEDIGSARSAREAGASYLRYDRYHHRAPARLLVDRPQDGVVDGFVESADVGVGVRKLVGAFHHLSALIG